MIQRPVGTVALDQRRALQQPLERMGVVQSNGWWPCGPAARLAGDPVPAFRNRWASLFRSPARPNCQPCSQSFCSDCSAAPTAPGCAAALLRPSTGPRQASGFNRSRRIARIRAALNGPGSSSITPGASSVTRWPEPSQPRSVRLPCSRSGYFQCSRSLLSQGRSSWRRWGCICWASGADRSTGLADGSTPRPRRTGQAGP
jgi:hypothetical protein